ncbi:DUF4468 domain-containing protein [Thalassotalea crassostreae]|uniref:DUF4468 domain-containing protein n=1 Tax=Thalassotalea crassostreae TaxID=1763536 RepID=UPI0008391ADE|nr:DUF4468 domain-containing protein [Thalassotalea crassostreae]
MKNLILVISSLIFLSACQMTGVYVSDLPLEKEKIISFDNKSKSELYGNTLDFFPHYWKNSKAVIQMQDENRGRIIAKGNIGSHGYGVQIKATVQIDVKDGKARISITHISNKSDQPGAIEYAGISRDGMIKDNQQAIDNLFFEYERFINQNISNDDW